jgi:hypothetical protein
LYIVIKKREEEEEERAEDFRCFMGRSCVGKRTAHDVLEGARHLKCPDRSISPAKPAIAVFKSDSISIMRFGEHRIPYSQVPTI